MLVGLGGQAVATVQAAAFEHLSSVSSGHALAETMYTHTAADLGLVRSFRHKLSSQKKIIAIPSLGNVAAC